MENVCKFFQYGHCKFGETCRKEHVSEKCRDFSCEREKSGCSQRHPTVCKYFKTYRKCKFGDYCSYEHELSSSEIPSESETFMDKNQKLIERVELLEATIIHLVKHKEKDMDIFERLINNMVDRIANLEKKENVTNKSSNEVDERENTIEIVNDTAGSEIFDDSTTNIPQLDGSALSRSPYQCDECEFQSSGEETSKTHKKKKHKRNRSKGNRQRQSHNLT